MPLQFPDHNLFTTYTDEYGQVWNWNGSGWVRRTLPPGIDDAPRTGQQYARYLPNTYVDGSGNTINPPGRWELVSADQWYLGGFSSAPILDNYNEPLRQGHTYYNTSTSTVYVWDGGEWDAFSGVSEIATLAEFRWDKVTAGRTQLFADMGGVPEPDDHGHVPIDPWVEGQIIVSVYLDDGTGFTKQVEQRGTDGILHAAQATWAPSDGPLPTGVGLWNYFEVTASVVETLKRPAFEIGDFIQAITVNPDTDPDNLSEFAANWKVIPIASNPDFGVETASYDYTVDYDTQVITFTNPLSQDDDVIVVIGTLAASEYLKHTFENVTGWSFVTDSFLSRDPTKLATQGAIYDYLDQINTSVNNLITAGLESRIGVVFDFAGTTPPSGALVCDNSIQPISAYPLLFAAIGHTWDTFNGAAPPDSADDFRLPPSVVNGEPLYFAGTSDSEVVGSFLANQNKLHSHTNRHRHNATTAPDGGHDHNLLIRNANGNIASGDSIQWFRGERSWYENTGGPSNTNPLVQSEANHTHSVSVSDANLTTSRDGGATARPDTALVLKCIWAQ